MKLGPIHADRIEALSYYQHALEKVMKPEDAYALITKLQECARTIVDAAPEDADPGRITHAIDKLRGALDSLSGAVDIGLSKNKRIRAAEALFGVSTK